jgi:hypothetical protein
VLKYSETLLFSNSKILGEESIQTLYYLHIYRDIMGTNNSKDNLDSTLSTIDSHKNMWRSSIQNKTIIHSGWQEIYRCSHTDWLHHISRIHLF